MSVLLKTIRSASLHIDAELTGRKWIKSAFELMEVSRFWRKMLVNRMSGGREDGDPNFYEKVTRIDQAAVTVRTRASQWCKLNLLTRTVNEVLPHAMEIGSRRGILVVNHEI